MEHVRYAARCLYRDQLDELGRGRLSRRRREQQSGLRRTGFRQRRAFMRGRGRSSKMALTDSTGRGQLPLSGVFIQTPDLLRKSPYRPANQVVSFAVWRVQCQSDREEPGLWMVFHGNPIPGQH